MFPSVLYPKCMLFVGRIILKVEPVMVKIKEKGKVTYLLDPFTLKISVVILPTNCHIPVINSYEVAHSLENLVLDNLKFPNSYFSLFSSLAFLTLH